MNHDMQNNLYGTPYINQQNARRREAQESARQQVNWFLIALFVVGCGGGVFLAALTVSGDGSAGWCRTGASTLWCK